MPRPRIYPEGTTASDRAAASVAALVERGGARICFRLSPEAHAALQQLVDATGAPTKQAMIERLLLDATHSTRAMRPFKPAKTKG